MITAILIISFMVCSFFAIVGMIVFVILKLMGYEPQDMEECWEENYEEKLRNNVD